MSWVCEVVAHAWDALPPFLPGYDQPISDPSDPLHAAGGKHLGTFAVLAKNVEPPSLFSPDLEQEGAQRYRLMVL